MNIDLEAISARNTDAQRRRLGLDYRDALQAHMRDIPALLAEVERQAAEIKTLSDFIKAYTDICDKHQETHRKLMDKLASVTAERDEEIARAEKAEEDIEILASHLDPCEICESKRNCVHPASCPERNHSSFRYCGAGKEQKHG